MNQPLKEGTHVRIVPREGRIAGQWMIRVKRHKKPNGRYTYTEVPVYLVEFEDGSKARLSGWEIEEVGE